MAKIKGLDSLLNRLGQVGKFDLSRPMEKACLVVENAAKQYCPVGSGELRRSITHKNNGLTGEIGTNLYYAPYVEYGTGIYAKDGNGREGYWVFVKGSNFEGSDETRKTYTLEQAKQIMAILRSKGLEAYYTNGQRPNPFLETALNDNLEQIREIFKQYIEEELDG